MLVNGNDFTLVLSLASLEGLMVEVREEGQTGPRVFGLSSCPDVGH